jgi:hypothetical protein
VKRQRLRERERERESARESRVFCSWFGGALRFGYLDVQGARETGEVAK